ncbi:MAG: hypothetical protein JXB08_02070 [Bacilli bacterium]|nr:hypothetical protein [Bacilli bacterium]MBN2876234.1 hypothetical protein [Bacilli bacterium]
MKALKTKVIMSAVVLLFALVATIGSTYAWFTVSNTVTVNQFTVDVQSAETLLIRVWDGESVLVSPDNEYTDYGWTLDSFSSSVNVLSSSQYDTEIGAAYFLPVTALKGEDQTGGYFDTVYTDVDFTTLRSLTANAIDDPATYGRELTAANANSASGGYIELKFWLLKPAGINSKVTFDYTITDGGGTTYENAMFFGTLGDSNQYIFGDDRDLDFAWTSGMAGYTNGALDAPSNTSLLSTAATASLGTVNSTEVLTLETANVPELVTIYIWMEGWDQDASNAVMGAAFDISLTFSLVA